MDATDELGCTVSQQQEEMDRKVRLQNFALNFLNRLSTGVRSDSTIQNNIRNHCSKLCSNQITPAQAIVDARRELGRSNESYLQFSVMILWSGEGADETMLYPSSAEYTATLGETAFRTMARVTQDELESVDKLLREVALHLAYYLAISSVRSYIRWRCYEKYGGEACQLYKAMNDVEFPTNRQPEDYNAQDATKNISPDFNHYNAWVLFTLQMVSGEATWLTQFRECIQELCAPSVDRVLDMLFDVQPNLMNAFMPASLEGVTLGGSDTSCQYDGFDLLKTQPISIDQYPQETVLCFVPKKTKELLSPDLDTTKKREVFEHLKRIVQGSAETDTLSQSYGNNTSAAVRDLFDRMKERLSSYQIGAFLEQLPLSFETWVLHVFQNLDNGRFQRTLASTYLSILRGIVCLCPPHLTLDNTDYWDGYDTPRITQPLPEEYAQANIDQMQAITPNSNQSWMTNNSNDTFMEDVHSLYSTKHTGRKKTFKSYFEYPSNIILHDINVDNTRVFKPLWKNSVLNKDDINQPCIGNVRIDSDSLNVSYASVLRALVLNLRQNEFAQQLKELRVEAALKLEMLPSLRYVFNHASRFQTYTEDYGWTAPTNSRTNDFTYSAVHGLFTINSAITVTPISSTSTCYNFKNMAGDISEVYGSVNTKDRNVTSESNVPNFASIDDLRGCLQVLRKWVEPSNLTNTSARDVLRMRARVLKETHEEILSRGRMQFSGHKRRSDQEERERRNAIWSDSLRELDICGDPFYRFLKDMAGTLHEDVTMLIELEDRTMEANQRLYREQRRDTLREINKFSQRVMETVINTVFRQSKMKADLDNVTPMSSSNGGTSLPNPSNATSSQPSSSSPSSSLGQPLSGGEFADSVVVISDESVQRVKELANGTAGLGFLEANDALQSFLQSQQGKPISLRELLLGMRGVLDTFRDYAIDSLQHNQTQSGRASLEYLANPRNSYVVRMKNETFAAIRSAYLLLRRQLLDSGLSQSQIPTAYHCIEGNQYELCNQFAQLAAYQLSHSRTFSSAGSVYLGATPARLNMNMLKISLNKMCNRVMQAKSSNLL